MSYVPQGLKNDPTSEVDVGFPRVPTDLPDFSEVSPQFLTNFPEFPKSLRFPPISPELPRAYESLPGLFPELARNFRNISASCARSADCREIREKPDKASFLFFA